MQQGVAEKAILNDELWRTIHHHRSTLTSMQGVNYTPDIRDRIQLIPPMECRDDWKKDYEIMRGAMIYSGRPEFEVLMERFNVMFSRTSR